MPTNATNEFFQLMTSNFSETTYAWDSYSPIKPVPLPDMYVLLHTCKVWRGILNRALFWFQNEWILRWIMSDRAVVARCMDKRTITCQNCTQNTCTLSFPNFFVRGYFDQLDFAGDILFFKLERRQSHKCQKQTLGGGGDQKQMLLFLIRTDTTSIHIIELRAVLYEWGKRTRKWYVVEEEKKSAHCLSEKWRQVKKRYRGPRNWGYIIWLAKKNCFPTDLLKARGKEIVEGPVSKVLMHISG